jgi:hypothetical protein
LCKNCERKFTKYLHTRIFDDKHTWVMAVIKRAFKKSQKERVVCWLDDNERVFSLSQGMMNSQVGPLARESFKSRVARGQSSASASATYQAS